MFKWYYKKGHVAGQRYDALTTSKNICLFEAESSCKTPPLSLLCVRYAQVLRQSRAFLKL